jgi:predicted ATPase
MSEAQPLELSPRLQRVRPGDSAVKIVLTGGPGAGKSTAARLISQKLGPGVVYVPEAATQVYERIGRKWSDLNPAQRRETQAAMYRLQVEQEVEAIERAAREGASILLLDRGTLDGAGYWPDGVAAFWGAMGTTPEAELARYTAVIWLETAASLGLYDHDASNAVRFENAPQAIESGELMASLWRAHPRFETVRAERDFGVKLQAIERALLAIARGDFASDGAAGPR